MIDAHSGLLRTRCGQMRRLTKTMIDALEPQNKGFITYCPTLPGFGVRTAPTGRKVYVARYRTTVGVERLQTIGRVSDVSLEEAREEARTIFNEARKGADPVAEKRATAEVLDNIFVRYQREVQAFKKPKTHYHNDVNYRIHLSPRFGKQRLNAITAKDINQFLVDYSDKKPTANNCLAVMRKLLTWANVEPNPCKGLMGYKIERQHRVLTTLELQRINEALDNFTPWFALLIRLLILTGARLREIMHAETAWLNLEMRTLSLPTSKSGAKVIQLPYEAIELLRGCENRRWIIQEPWNDKPLIQPYVSWWKLCDMLGLKGVRIHDIRHSYGSRAHAVGLSQRAIATLLGHKQLKTTERYLHAFVDGKTATPVDIAASAMMKRKP